MDLDYPILSDPDREVAMEYGLVNNERGNPKRWTFYIGKEGDILFVDTNVSPRSHGADIAAKLEELGVEKK